MPGTHSDSLEVLLERKEKITGAKKQAAAEKCQHTWWNSPYMWYQAERREHIGNDVKQAKLDVKFHQLLWDPVYTQF